MLWNIVERRAASDADEVRTSPDPHRVPPFCFDCGADLRACRCPRSACLPREPYDAGHVALPEPA